MVGLWSHGQHSEAPTQTWDSEQPAYCVRAAIRGACFQQKHFLAACWDVVRKPSACPTAVAEQFLRGVTTKNRQQQHAQQLEQTEATELSLQRLQSGLQPFQHSQGSPTKQWSGGGS